MHLVLICAIHAVAYEGEVILLDIENYECDKIKLNFGFINTAAEKELLQSVTLLVSEILCSFVGIQEDFRMIYF
jgi:hypothetical protein